MDILRTISDEEAEAAWQQFCRNHVESSRLFLAAQFGEPLTDAELAHLLECKSCDRLFEAFSR